MHLGTGGPEEHPPDYVDPNWLLASQGGEVEKPAAAAAPAEPAPAAKKATRWGKKK